MRKLHHMQETQRLNMTRVLNVINQAKDPSIQKLKEYCFDNFGLAPDATSKYLSSLEEMGKITLIPNEDKIVKLKQKAQQQE